MKKFIQSLDLNIIPDNLNDFQKFIFYEVILLTITLFAILHILGYIYCMYILKDTELEKKYYIVKFFINLYRKTTYLFLIYDLLFIIIVYLFIIFFGLYIIWH
jgi:hypothetical protein